MVPSLPSSVGMALGPYRPAGRRPVACSYDLLVIMAPLAMLPSWQLRHIMMPLISSGIRKELARLREAWLHKWRHRLNVVALGQNVAIQRTKVLAPQERVAGIGCVNGLAADGVAARAERAAVRSMAARAAASAVLVSAQFIDAR